MKNFISSIVVVLLFIFASVAFAQDQQQSSVVENSDTQQTLFASNIVFDKDGYPSRGSVNGTFNMSNVGDYVVSGASYSVELVQILEETHEYENEDSSVEKIAVDRITDSFGISGLSKPININPGNELINFHYEIPQRVPEGRIGLLVRLYINELEVGYEFKEINITGPRVYYLNTNGQVLVSATSDSEKEIFQLFEGPRVNKDEVASIYVYIDNEKSESFNLTPRLKIFAGNNSNSPEVASKIFDTITIPSGQTELSYQLDLNFEPGVYTGVVEYLDDRGDPKSIPLEFRYIIDNDSLKSKISEVLYSSKALVDENLVVSVSYMDPPLNFRKNADGSYKDKRVEHYFELNQNFNIDDFINGGSEEYTGIEPSYISEGMSAEVRIIDVKSNSLIATNRTDFTDSAEAAVDLGKIVDTDQVFVEVDLLQNGEVVDSYSEMINVETYKFKNIFEKIWYEYKMYILGGVLLLALIVIIILLRKSKIDKGAGMAGLVAIVLVASSMLVAHNAEAQRTSGFKVEGSYLTIVNVNSPKPPSVQVYEPNQTIVFDLGFKFGYCTNNGYSLYARNSNPSTGAMGSWSTPNVGAFDGMLWAKHPRYNASVVKVFKAPSSPGTYTIYYDLLVHSGEWGNFKQGSATFRVANDVCKNIAGTQEVAPSGTVIINSGGRSVCINPAEIQCSVSNNRLDVKESVTYTAKTVTGMKAMFNWYRERSMITSNLVKTESNTAVSTYTTSFNHPGVYYTTANATVSGQSGVCRVLVTVGDEYKDVPLEGSALQEYLQSDEYLYYTDEDGTKYPLNRDAPIGNIDFDFENGITNDTCKAIWNAENVLKCSLYKNGTLSKKIDFSGNENLTPGTYQISCIQAQNGAEIRSESRTCIQNPDFREL